MPVTRKHLVKVCCVLAVGLVGLHGGFFPSLVAFADERVEPGYGPLQRDREGFLDLPRGFAYRVISRTGDEMDDGLLVPGMPDGMAAFPGRDGRTILIRNHEVFAGQTGPFGADHERLPTVEPAKIYDPAGGRPCPGGTTTIIFNTRTQEVESEFLSLTGTLSNCAGGATPWGSWISCEETVVRAGRNGEFFFEKDHGYNFEVPVSEVIGLVAPVPLMAMGRFVHEAVAVDPRTGIVYQTEDLDDGLIYRFIPKEPGRLVAGGRLQALMVSGQPSLDTRNWDPNHQIAVGTKLRTRWIDLEDVDSPQDDLRNRGFEAGAARFARGEGMWAATDGVYFACTSGGTKQFGQIWRYRPSRGEGTADESADLGVLELFIEPNDSTIIKNGDNLTIAPSGDIVICEDRLGSSVRLIGVTPARVCYTIADLHAMSEFAGATFSPDGSTLFVNLQFEGLTLAITGSWIDR